MVIKSRKNYYEILGVTPDSEAGEIKSAYRRLARKFHPDINKAPDSVRKFKDILEAYEVLSDEIKRKQYNMVNGFYKTSKSSYKTEYKTNPQHKTNESFTKEPSAEEQETPTSDNEIYRKKFFKDSINSILDEITRSHYSQKQQKNIKNGDDINTDISISLEEAINGTERILNIMHKELCPNCRGRKFINGSKCSVCEGSGEFTSHKKITVKIPKGIKNNAKLRILNEGNPGFNGGKSGTLYITVKIEKHSNFEIDGANILYKIPITPFEAVLGGKIEIPALSGKINLILPAMTHSGQKFRLSNQGLKTNGKFGDMIVTVEIQLPNKLSNEEIKMYEKLKKMSQTNIRENITND